MWTVPREWPGDTAFIVAGGPSIKGWPAGRSWPAMPAEDLALLKGRRVILVNSAYQTLPEADFLFFADRRWWSDCPQHRAALRSFGGRIVTTARGLTDDKRLLTMLKVKPDKCGGLTDKPTHLALQRTSLQGAMNLALHLGAVRIVLLGADMQPAPDGRTHHHKPHKWRQKPDCWDRQMEQLRLAAKPLADRGIEVINCSPTSLIDWWPKRSLEDVTHAQRADPSPAGPVTDREHAVER